VKLRCPKFVMPKKSTFENLDSLIDHHINKSRSFAFSTWKVQSKDNSILKRPSIAFCVEAIEPNNPMKVKSNSSVEGTKPKLDLDSINP
jgi:hypothetical protein